MKKKFSWTGVLVIAGCFAAYLFISFSSWSEPIMGDETNFVNAVWSVEDNASRNFLLHSDPEFALWHPPAYIHSIWVPVKVFGFSEVSVRLVGFFSFLISLIFIYLIAGRIFKGRANSRGIAAVACALFALNPLALRGSLLVDIDGTILNALLLCVIWALAGEQGAVPFGRRMLFYSVLFACALWSKLTSTSILIAALGLSYALEKDFKRLASIIAIGLLGGVIFALSWWLYAWAFHKNFAAIFKVFSFTKTFFARSGSSRDILSLLRSVWAPFIWCSPYFFALAYMSIRKVFRESAGERKMIHLRQLALCGLLILITYVFFGGVTHSFPKYHYPMVSMWVIPLAYLLVEKIALSKSSLWWALAVVTVCVWYNVVAVGDPLYTLNYAWKEDIILNGGRFASRIIAKEFLQIFLMMLTFPLAYLLLRLRRGRESFVAALFISLLALNISLLFVQGRASYNTVYCYGAKGVREAAGFIRGNSDAAQPIFAPFELALLTNKHPKTREVSSMVDNPQVFLNALEKYDVACVAYGITGNTVKQYKEVFNSDAVRVFLARNYKKHSFDAYTVWIKK